MSSDGARPALARNDEPTAETIGAAQRGCPKAWELLHACCAGRLRALVSRLSGRRLLAREEIDDLVGLVFQEIVVRLPALQYRSGPEFLGWLARLASSTVATRALHHTAWRRRPPAVVLSLGHEEGEVSEENVRGTGEDPARAAEVGDECARVMSCARRLHPGDRRLVELFLARDGDVPAMGAALGIGADAARMRWLRVRRQIQALVLRRAA